VKDDDEIIIFNAAMFERITNSEEAAAAAGERRVQNLSSVINVNIPDEGKRILREHLARNSFSRRKALSVSNKKYLKELTPERIMEVLEKHELLPSDYSDADGLVVTETNVKTILALLNEDVFAGDFSGQEFAA